MSRIRTMLMSFALIGTGALVSYPLFAHCGQCAADGKTIVEQLDKNKLTLARAISAAEQHSKGRAISVISELNHDHKLAMEVYCIVSDPSASSSSGAAQPKVMKCQIDDTGAVKEMKEAKAFPITEDDDDHGHGHDHAPAPAPPSGTGAGGKSGDPKGSAMNIVNQEVDAACGVCVYKMQGQVGCPLAVKIDGKPYIVQGAKWSNHDYCDRNCKAVVTGRIEGDKFIVTKLEEKS